MSKMREDELERRRAHNARIIDEYQVFDYRPVVASTEAASHVVANVTPIKPAYRLSILDRFELQIFVAKLESDPEQVNPELVQQTHDWTPAHFDHLAQRSPKALARVARALRDRAIKLSVPHAEQVPKLTAPRNHILKLKAPIPPHEIVFAGYRPVIVEKVKRRVAGAGY
jgi:hypothetical protein